jgi:two-component system sensor histidine kinase/response regulator
MKRDILYVDDELDNLVVFEATFDSTFKVYTANSAAKALELLERQSFPVVVADQRMPSMTGAELFEVMRRKYPHTKRVMLTGYADSKAMLDAINQGQVYYFLKKPWERHDVFSVLSRAIEAYDLSVANSALTERLVAVDRCAALGRSAARIAHEMGNQLCMLPLLELIEERYADHDDLMQTAAVARRTYDRLTELVNEVKSFVRFERTGIDLQPLALADVLHELVGFLRYDKSLPAGRLALRIDAEASVRGHAIKLQQVLINLIQNAAHAIRGRADGQIGLELDVKRAEAVIAVRDNGCGMTAEVAARIWEPFFTTKGDEGNGLGLDIVKDIIEAHSGRIECETAIGKGTAFIIRLPLHNVTVEAPARTPAVSRMIAPALDTTAYGNLPSLSFGR